MAYFEILLPLALILTLSKGLSILCAKIGLPKIVGMLLAGVLISLIKYIPGQEVLSSFGLQGVAFIAKIGVILIMFSAGIETDIKMLKQTGVAAIIITSMGVVLPLALGFLVAAAFNGGLSNMSYEQLIQNLFYGVILTATSVSVTVACLKELGKLNNKIGTAIVSAAIIDDIIGVVILSFVIGIKDGATNGTGGAWNVLLMTVLFFVFAGVVGVGTHYLFKWISKRYPHSRRVPIFGFAFCFLISYIAEKVFGVADITGAFFAGLVLSTVKTSNYIDSKIEVASYMIFAPVFFANIGINTSFEGLDANMALFGLSFVAVGMLGKFIGCFVGAKLGGFNVRDSLASGVGMMVRAEVVLVSTQKGIDNHIIPSSITPFVLILIIATTFLVPLLLKFIYSKDKNTPALQPVLQADLPQVAEADTTENEKTVDSPTP